MHTDTSTPVKAVNKLDQNKNTFKYGACLIPDRTVNSLHSVSISQLGEIDKFKGLNPHKYGFAYEYDLSRQQLYLPVPRRVVQ